MNVDPSTYMHKDQRSVLNIKSATLSKNESAKVKSIDDPKLRKNEDKRTYADVVKEKRVRWKEQSDSKKQVTGKQIGNEHVMLIIN